MRLRSIGLIVILALGILGAPLAADAQQPGKVARIGYLSLYSRSPDSPLLQGFRDGLRELGWVEGRTITIEWRFADLKPDRLPAFAAELVDLKVDVIVALSNLAAFPAKQATDTVPIVVLASHDAVGTGLVASLARPGANITGVESMAPELDAKRLELLKEISPRIASLSVLYNPGDAAARLHLRHTETGAQALGIKVRPLEVRGPDEFEQAFAAMTRERPEGLLVFTDPLTFSQRNRIVEFTVKNRLPAVYEFKEFVDLGGLVAYGPSLKGMGQRGATYVDKILKGAKPADLPMEQPTRFELVINLKTAKALGLTIPQSVLIRADEVIQ